MMIGQHKRDITIVSYRQAWPELYNQEAARLLEALGENALQIEHIGSTSIPGLAAKPIIDMMVAVVSYAQALELIPVVEGLGYEYKPHDIIPERVYFSKEREPEYRTHHLNLTEPDSGFWKDQLAFRDYLRANDEFAAEYVELKRRLAEEHALTGQIPLQGKTKFVARILEMAEDEKRND
jgi:GrpB-like predicted nucleotidyltransferase (UPF0157 family)